MKYKSKQQRWVVEQQYRQKLLKLNPNLDDGSGIYFLTREENGFKYAYIGQAKHIMQRMCGHLMGYDQHIDKSIKKHKLYSNDNPCGWKVGFLHYSESKLDEMEQHWILEYANGGYQLLNKTSGSQGEGKAQIDEYKPPKGYRDGIKQGRKNLAKELLHIIEKHLIVMIKPEKANNKVSQEQFEKFWDLLKADEEGKS